MVSGTAAYCDPGFGPSDAGYNCFTHPDPITTRYGGTRFHNIVTRSGCEEFR